MAKKMMTEMMAPMAMEMPPYEGRVREDILESARQSSSFLTDSHPHMMMEPMMRDMLRADLIATGKHAIEHANRAVAVRIKDEAYRIYGDDVITWY